MGGPWEVSEELLKELGRVERVEVALGKQARVWYLNLLKSTKEKLNAIGYGKLFLEGPPAAPAALPSAET